MWEYRKARWYCQASAVTTTEEDEQNRTGVVALGLQYEGRWMARVRGGAPNKSGDSPSWRRRCCKKVRVPVCKCVEIVERRRSALREKAFQPPSNPCRQHSSCDAKHKHACMHPLCYYNNTRPRHRPPPARHPASAQQRSHAVLPRSDRH